MEFEKKCDRKPGHIYIGILASDRNSLKNWYGQRWKYTTQCNTSSYITKSVTTCLSRQGNLGTEVVI